MTSPAIALNELIEITRDGQTFYTDAVQRVSSPYLKAVFRALIDVKAQMIATLSEHVRKRGLQPSTRGTFAGSLHQVYAEVRARLSRRGDMAFIAQLEMVEGRLLDAFEQTAAGTDDAELRRIVVQHLPKIRLCHDQMCNLKVALAA
jgi:uncharacterized protein (TIGR02284 family)